MTPRLLIGAFAALLLVASGCAGNIVPTPAGMPGVTQVTLTSSPASPVTGSPTTLTVTAQNSNTKIDTIDIDFENDGTPDEEQTFDALSVSTTFSHVYTTAGSVIVRTEVEDQNGGIVSKTLLLIVETPPPAPDR